MGQFTVRGYVVATHRCLGRYHAWGLGTTGGAWVIYRFNTIQDVLDHLVVMPEVGDDQFIFEGELAEVKIYVDGENYHGSMPASFARGLWEYQQCLYKAVAFALYGDDNYRRLTQQDLETFQLVFKLDEGSLDLQALLTDFLKGLAEGFKNMDSKHKLAVLTFVAFCLTTGWTATSVVESSQETKRAEIAANLQIQEGTARAAEFQAVTALAGNVVDAFSHYGREGAKAIIKGAPDADVLSIGKAQFDKSEIGEVNQRSSKEAAKSEVVREEFLIVRVETRDSDITRFVIGRKNGVEFTAFMDDTEFTEDEIRKVWSAARGRTAIELEVNMTIHKGAIKSAQIVEIL